LFITNIKNYVYSIIGQYVSRITYYYDTTIQFSPSDEDSMFLLNSIKNRNKIICNKISELEDFRGKISEENDSARVAVVLNGNFNYDLDIQGSLEILKNRLTRNDRLIAILYNPYLRWVYKLASYLHLRKGPEPITFLTRNDLSNLCELTGFRLLQLRPMVYFPCELLGLGNLINRILSLIPGIRWLGFTSVAVLQPVIPNKINTSVSVIIPARNERGNIPDALERIKKLNISQIEVIFIEGHSTDGTWQEIQNHISGEKWPFPVSAYQQEGVGKSDAVRLGFSKANNDLLIILDADLTMPPEMLPRFIKAYDDCNGDFINGHRLLYPMEGEAMRFLNWAGNIFFAKSLSYVLETKIGDSLCGTKLVSRHDYQRITRWRNDFGDFDPFGDFELLFPAAILALGIINIPVAYKARTYGSTQIRRFYHGFLLLKMTFVAFFRIKLN
jgi:hypothetical protein